MKPSVFIVVPNWNGAAWLGECLASLQNQSAGCRVVVVDNGSTDGSVRLVQAHYPKVKLVQLDHNYGFAGGVNRGITYALEQQADFVALFNNDAVADRRWLEHLLAAAHKHPRAGIVTGKLLNRDGSKIDSTGDFYSVWGFAYPRGRGEADRGQYDRAEAVFGASGGASLYRATMLQQIGLFDSDFFAYYEDVDLSWRAQLAGWGVYYQPAAIAYHHIGATSARVSGFARYHAIKNFYYLYIKNMPGWLFWKYLPRFWLAAGLMVVNSLRRWQISPLVRGYATMLIHLPVMLVRRRQIQRRRRVSLAAIDSILYHQIPPTQNSLLRLKRWATRRRSP